VRTLIFADSNRKVLLDFFPEDVEKASSQFCLLVIWQNRSHETEGLQGACGLEARMRRNIGLLPTRRLLAVPLFGIVFSVIRLFVDREKRKCT